MADETNPILTETESNSTKGEAEERTEHPTTGYPKASGLPTLQNALFPSGGNRLFGFIRRDIFLYVIGILLVAGAGYYVYVESTVGLFTAFSHGVCILLAFLWLILVHDNIPVVLSRINWKETRIHPAWVVVFFALMLRYYSYSIFPPINQTGFEELETGEVASNYLIAGRLPIGFRFTNLLAALGLTSDSTLRLFALRLPFQIVGLISLVLLVFSLRSLKVSWLPTLLVTFIAATMRFLVVATAVADELFFGMSILTVVLLFLIKSEDSKTDQPFWLSAAGIFAGMLMYEYASYRAAIVVLIFLSLWKCFTSKVGDRSRAWFNIFSFLIPFILVALPIIFHTLRHPEYSELFESFTRHSAGRATLLPETGVFQLRRQAQALTGWTVEISPYYTPPRESLLLPPIGWLFGISFLHGLFFAGRGFPRILGINILLTVLGASFLANNLNIGRMAPTFPMLLLLSGFFWKKCMKKSCAG